MEEQQKKEYPQVERACPKCGCKEFKTEPVTFANGSKHIKASCSKCQTFVGYEKQTGSRPGFVMPFGKYKDQTLEQIADAPKGFDTLVWYSQNLSPGNVKQRVDDFLKSLEQK